MSGTANMLLRISFKEIKKLFEKIGFSHILLKEQAKNKTKGEQIIKLEEKKALFNFNIINDIIDRYEEKNNFRSSKPQ